MVLGLRRHALFPDITRKRGSVVVYGRVYMQERRLSAPIIGATGSSGGCTGHKSLGALTRGISFLGPGSVVTCGRGGGLCRWIVERVSGC